MAKKKIKHQNFKLSKHPYSNTQVYMFIVVAAAVGLLLGWIFKDQTAAVLGISSY